jgi:hypothetical protein
VVVLVSVLEYELDELVLVLASHLPGDLHFWSTVMVLGFVCYLYGLYFFPGHDTQAWLLYDSPLALPCCCLPSNSLHMVKLEPTVACSVLVCLCLSCAVQEFGQAQVCCDSLHCPN